jgi:type I restriction enzyme M protein
MDAAEYKHTVLGLIFLKYISDAFEELHAALIAGEGQYAGADPEDAENTGPRTCFGSHRRLVGSTCKTMPNSRTSAS